MKYIMVILLLVIINIVSIYGNNIQVLFTDLGGVITNILLQNNTLYHIGLIKREYYSQNHLHTMWFHPFNLILINKITEHIYLNKEQIYISSIQIYLQLHMMNTLILIQLIK